MIQLASQATQSILARSLSNKHTSAAAIAYLASKAGVKLLTIWFPELTPQLEQTGELIESLALGYGFLMAGDGKKDLKDSQQTNGEEKKET